MFGYAIGSVGDLNQDNYNGNIPNPNVFQCVKLITLRKG